MCVSQVYISRHLGGSQAEHLQKLEDASGKLEQEPKTKFGFLKCDMSTFVFLSIQKKSQHFQTFI